MLDCPALSPSNAKSVIPRRFSLLFAVLLAAGTAHASSERDGLRALRIDAADAADAPSIDGVLDEAVWQRAPLYDEFHKHQPRDGQRDHQARDGQPRDNQGRDSQTRDNQNRDNQARDNQGRDSQRDNQPREQRPRSEPRQDARVEPRQDPRPDLSEENAPQFLQQPSLPEVMPATEDDGGAAVRTPEAEAPAKPARTRVSRPRAPRAVAEDGTPAPTRSRRKPVAEAERPAPVRPEGDQD